MFILSSGPVLSKNDTSLFSTVQISITATNFFNNVAQKTDIHKHLGITFESRSSFKAHLKDKLRQVEVLVLLRELRNTSLGYCR